MRRAITPEQDAYNQLISTEQYQALQQILSMHLMGLTVVWEPEQKVPDQQAILGGVLPVCQKQLLHVIEVAQ